jgi:hypothetical protein
MRMVDDLLEQNARRASLGQSDWDEGMYVSRPPPPTFAPLPGPWGFLTSGYAVGLLVMVRMITLSALSSEIGHLGDTP